MTKYYEEHKNEFRIEVPQKKIRYLFVYQNKVGEKLQISDEDLRKEYDALKPENKQAGVRVQQIVLRVARPELDGEVRAKADGLVQQARAKGTPVSEETFAELARGNSEDPATAKAGGALSGVVRRNPNKPDDPLQSTLTMEPGQVLSRSNSATLTTSSGAATRSRRPRGREARASRFAAQPPRLRRRRRHRPARRRAPQGK